MARTAAQMDNAIDKLILTVKRLCKVVNNEKEGDAVNNA